MTYQFMTIMGACDYSIASLQNLKKAMLNVNAANPDLNWGIGGMTTTLVSNLIQICDQVFQEAVARGDNNAKADLREIGRQLNEFIEKMVTHE